MLAQDRVLRSQSGGIMFFVVICALVLAMLVTAFVFFTLNFGGSQEVRNSVDAGALNVGQQITEVKVKAETEDEHEFDDVADSQGKFGLTNINRVWAKALLVRMNANADNGSAASSHADALLSAAKRLSTRLIARLKDNNGRYFFFNTITMQNDPKMLGAKTKIDAEKGGYWQESYVDRKAESNIIVKPEQFPGNTASQLKIIKAPDGLLHLPGYTPIIKDNAENYYCVPYKVGETTHLISRGFFDLNTLFKGGDVEGWQTPIPNSFSSEGKCVAGQSIGQKAVACVQVNPQRTFKLAIPHSFVRVVIHTNKLNYRVNGIPRGQDEYGTLPTTRTITSPDGFGVGAVTVIASVGLEYVPPNLFKAIYALPGDHDRLTETLLQRCREMVPDCSEGEFRASLAKCPLVPNEEEYLIFPVGDDKNGSVKLAAAPASLATGTVGWIKTGAKPDGEEGTIASEFVGPIPAPVPAPNIAIITLAGAGQPIYLPSFVTETGEEKWTPGSGYGQCLGELKIDRTTTIDANGVVEPIP